jgi:hypothetical protein
VSAFSEIFFSVENAKGSVSEKRIHKQLSLGICIHFTFARKAPKKLRFARNLCDGAIQHFHRSNNSFIGHSFGQVDWCCFVDGPYRNS